jgi:hypothetical protein
MRGLKDINFALEFTDGFLAYYNFIRPHEGLDGRTPAEVAGVDYNIKSWSGVIKLNEPRVSGFEGEPEMVRIRTIPAELEAARRTVSGLPYKAGRKRKPKISQTGEAITGRNHTTTVRIVIWLN